MNNTLFSMGPVQAEQTATFNKLGLKLQTSSPKWLFYRVFNHIPLRIQQTKRHQMFNDYFLLNQWHHLNDMLENPWTNSWIRDKHHEAPAGGSIIKCPCWCEMVSCSCAAVLILLNRSQGVPSPSQQTNLRLVFIYN